MKKGKQKEKYIAHVKTGEFYEYYSKQYFKAHDPVRNRVIIDRTSPYYLDKFLYNKIIKSFNLKIKIGGSHMPKYVVAYHGKKKPECTEEG